MTSGQVFTAPPRMGLLRMGLIAGALALAAPVLAHGPTPQQAEQRIEIGAAPDAVWAILADPATYADWHPGIAAVTMQGEGEGAKRTIEFTEGGSVVDGIDRIDPENREIRWRLSREDIESFPASYYTNGIKVSPAGDGSEVTWKASFFRADTTNEPEERFGDEAAVAAMEKLMTEGLAGLKAAAEAGPPG